MAEQVPIRVGLAGCGRAGFGMHVPELEGFKDRFRMVAACDLIAERRRVMAERFGCRTYRRIEDMIADPDVELVDIATRSGDHVEHALLALRAGKHVLLEKPIGVSHAEALRLTDAARRARGKLFARHNRRFEPPFMKVRELMASGLLGRVHTIKLRRNSYARRDDWQTILSCGGGQTLNWGPHIIDHALQLLESPVAGLWSDLQNVAARGDAEDCVKILFRGRNGRVVDLEIMGAAALSEPEYTVLGSRGALVSESGAFRMRYLDPALKLRPRRSRTGTPGVTCGTPEQLRWIEETVPVPRGELNDASGIWLHLYPAIREGAKFPITLDEALEVMRVISAVRKGTQFDWRGAGKA